eukprot:4335190-Amphidinium_carterae.1
MVLVSDRMFRGARGRPNSRPPSALHWSHNFQLYDVTPHTYETICQKRTKMMSPTEWLSWMVL